MALGLSLTKNLCRIPVRGVHLAVDLLAQETRGGSQAEWVYFNDHTMGSTFRFGSTQAICFRRLD